MWEDLETRFLARLYEDDTEVSMPTPDEKQIKCKSIKDFIERFKKFSLRCPEGMPLSMLVQTYRHNLHADIETNISIVCTFTWKELHQQEEFIEKSIIGHSFNDKGKQRTEATTACMLPSKFKGKNFMVIDMPTKPKKSSSPRQDTLLSQRA